MSKLFSYETLVHALAGATGSAVGMSAFYPLDTLRSRIQVEQSPTLTGSTWDMLLKVTKEEGFEALYQGIVPVIQSLCVSNFVHFYTFHAIRRYVTTKPTAPQDLLFGTLAGSVNVLITSPLWVVNTRMKLKQTPYKSLWQGLTNIAQTEGIKKLWSGTFASLLLVSNPGIQFMLYESLKRYLVKQNKFTGMAAFLVGALAKAIATTMTYPMQIIQSRLRFGQSLKPLIKEARTNPKVLFRGLETKLLQTVMTTALMFAVYEKIANAVINLLRASASKHRA